MAEVAVDAVRAVQAVKAVIAVQTKMAADARRGKIPPYLRHLTFFGKHDMWKYHEVSDNRQCNDCSRYAKKPVYFGDALRAFFPHLEIIDENRINLNVHEHCRCWLSRFKLEEED